ncbi:MAG: mechanosensitive ion channel family protein [Dongiaceae bacterium]
MPAGMRGTVLRSFIAIVFAAIVIATVAFATIASVSAVAQESDLGADRSIDQLLQAFPDTLTPEQVDAILAVSDPDALRAALRERLLLEMSARQPAAQAEVHDNLLSFYGTQLRSIGAEWPVLGETLSAAFAKPQGVYPAVRIGSMLTSVLLLLGVSIAATIVVGRILAPMRRTAMVRPDGSGRIAALGIWLLLDACQVAAFFVAALIYYAILDPQHPLAPALLSIVLYEALVALLVERLFNLLSAPVIAQRPLTGYQPGAARRLYWIALAVTILLVLVGAISRVLVLVAAPMPAIVALLVPLSALPIFLLIAIIWANRARIRDALERSLGGQYRAALIAAPILATAHLLALWILLIDALFRHQDQIGNRILASLLLALLAPLVTFALGGIIARHYRSDIVMENLRETEDVSPQVMRIMRAAWVVLAVLIVYGTAAIWEIDLKAYLGLGSAAVKAVFNVAIVILLGFVAWSLIVNAIDRSLRRAAEEGATPRAQRMKTLLPLLRRFLQFVLFSIVVMVLLSSIGIEIGPLLAGAGVVGLAIGLGAQQTIADILAGVFFLLEDSFRVGDYVEVGNIRGNVEGISMRSLKLRHHRGAVHTLPFGQMKSLTNYTRDWALMRLEFSVAPNTDIGLVKRIIKGIAKDLSEDPVMGPSFIEPLKSQGIRSVADGAVVIGVKFIAKPNEQFVIRREAYQRIIDAFNENGIALVGRSVVVKVEADDRVPPQVAAAAASVVTGTPDE